MKKITLIILTVILSVANQINAQEACASDANFLYYTPNTGWSNSEWYQIIDIDAEQLSTSIMSAHSGADGTTTSSTFSSGAFTTPIYTYNETTEKYEVTNVLWPVKFYMTCLAPTFYNSARQKVENGSNPSGTGGTAACTNNNNTVLSSPIWDKKGFIELSRQASEVASTPPSRHGYIQIDDLPQVERVQYSFSSTAWKRGFKLDIKYNDGPWEPLRWEANNINNIVTFAEQGYAFEEIIGKQEDPTSKISLRWRIWDGDSIHTNPVSSADPKPTFTTVNTPYAQQQVVRIHQIKIFSGVVPTVAPNAVRDVQNGSLTLSIAGRQLKLNETASIEIYSYEGKRILSANGNNFDLNNFSKGVYLIKASNENGRVFQKVIL